VNATFICYRERNLPDLDAVRWLGLSLGACAIDVHDPRDGRSYRLKRDSRVDSGWGIVEVKSEAKRCLP
jgi:hypothetical protein